MVTPELAAQIVRRFVLPMFEDKGAQLLRKKLQSGQGLEGTVLGDLKLTEHLSKSLSELKEKFDNREEAIEEAYQARDKA